MNALDKITNGSDVSLLAKPDVPPNFIMVRGIKYQQTTEDGKTSLLRFNEKHKMWVKLRFSKITAKNSIVEILSEQFITSQTGI